MAKAAFLAALLVVAACNPTKRLAEGELLLRKNRVEVKGSDDVSRDGLESTIRQEPNRRILGIFPFYLWAYNVPNPDNFYEVNSKRAAKLEEKNARRERKGKEPLQLKQAGSWWRETVGEPPVVLDTAQVSRSVQQMRTYMIKHGWFNARVEAEIKETRRRAENQREVHYTVWPGTPYTIDSISYRIPDSNIRARLGPARQGRSNLRPGKQFSIELLDAERTEINNALRNIGYYDFNKELIYFDVDSALGRHAVHLTLGIVPRRVPYEGDPDSLLTVPYRQFRVNSVTIIDRPALRDTPVERADTTLLRGYTMIDQGQLNVRPGTLAQTVLFNTGELYSIDRVTMTYRRMSALPIVRSTNIRFNPVEDDEENTLLNCVISTLPTPKQNVSLEGRGTNRGGFLGIQGAVSYQNRNIFGGAERLDINLTGGLEAQQLLTGSATGNDEATLGVGRNVRFNTLEFGPEIALTFPKFLLPVGEERFAKRANPRTTFRANLNYQQRPDYQRTRSFIALSYQWSETDEKQWAVNPIEISLISIDKSELFEEQLNQTGNIFLINSFNDHFIAASRIAYTYSTQRPGVRKRNSFYYRGEFESAGSLLRGLFRASSAVADENGSYQVLNINFAQYLKTTHDWRFYRQHNDKMSTAYRFTGGVGVPLNNLNVLPFEKSFFAGGANDIRAWEARTLGPGSFRDPERNFDKIGDILLEANVEYRFNLISFLEGALFVDAGNIWNIAVDEKRPGADFALDRFWREIAVGAGFGVRFNFDFFIVRLDAGLQMRDPTLDPGERWLFQGKELYNAYVADLNLERPSNRQLPEYGPRWNLNLGIGYPF